MRIHIQPNRSCRREKCALQQLTEVGTNARRFSSSRPEHELLLSCASDIWLSGFPLEQLDWNYLLRLSSAHVMDTLLLRALRPRWSAVPCDARDPLATRVESTARQCLAMSAELVRLSREFAARGLRAIAYKGPALAQILYGDVAARESGDLDFLVAEADVSRSLEILRDLGYAGVLNFTPRQQRAYATAECAHDLISSGGARVDLHWALTPRHLDVHFDFEQAWERHQTTAIGGQAVPVLSPEDTLLAAAIHGSKHLWSRLCWLHDVAACLRRFPELDWDVVLTRAEGQRALPLFLLGVSLAHDLLGADLPFAVRKRIALAERVFTLSARLRQQYLTTGMTGGDASRRWSATLQLYPWSDRARCALRFLSTSGVSEWSSVTLPDRLFPLYTLVRLCRIANAMVGRTSDGNSCVTVRPS